MVFPEVTLMYLALLSLVYSALALAVVGLRRKHSIPFGDGGNESLLRAIRAHGNFIEYVPLTALLVASLEAMGAPASHVHLLMGLLLFARVIHPIAFGSERGSVPYKVGRIGGAFVSWGVMTAAAVLLLVRLQVGGI